MFEQLCKVFRKSSARGQDMRRSLWHAQQIERNREWMRDFWGCQQVVPPKRSGQDGAQSSWLDEVDPHWVILKHLCRWSRAQFEAAPQAARDRAVADILGISLIQAALMRLGFSQTPVIWPDTLVERHGFYPWAIPEIHAFWAHLETLTPEQLGQIAAHPALADDALKHHWRELHRLVLAQFPDYHGVIQRAIEAASFADPPEHAPKLSQLKVRASFEVMAASRPHASVPCRYLALFGFAAPAELLRQNQPSQEIRP